MDKTFFDEQQLFQLLSLLEISDAAARHGVELLPTSFRKPNAKGLELVLYRLYAIIHGEAKAAKDFRNIWPVVDRNQAKDFNQKVSDWFKELRDRYQLESLSSMTASQLRSASGHRVVSTLLELSTLAMQIQYQRLAPAEAAQFSLRTPAEKDGRMLPLLEHAARDVAAISLPRQVQRFLDLTKQAAELQSALERDARELSEQYYAARTAYQQATLRTSTQELPPSPSSSVWSHYLNQLTGATQLTGAGADSAASSGMAALPSLLPDAAQLSVAVMTEMQHLGAMDSHLDQYPQVAELLASTVTSSAHPHAIDGSALLATARAESAAPTTADAPAIAPTMRFPADPVASDTPETLDIVNMLDQWVTGLEQAAGAISSLERAQGAAVAGGGGRSPRGMAGGGGRLFAPVSDSTGHAALLATQLRLHQDQEGQLQDLVARLKLRVMETESRLRDLEPRVVAATQELHADTSRTLASPHRASLMAPSPHTTTHTTTNIPNTASLNGHPILRTPPFGTRSPRMSLANQVPRLRLPTTLGGSANAGDVRHSSGVVGADDVGGQRSDQARRAATARHPRDREAAHAALLSARSPVGAVVKGVDAGAGFRGAATQQGASDGVLPGGQENGQGKGQGAQEGQGGRHQQWGEALAALAGADMMSLDDMMSP